MMPLDGVIAALVSDADASRSREQGLVAAGADLRRCGSPHDLASLLASEVIDVVIVAEMSSAAARTEVLGVLREEYRARTLPTVVLVPPGVAIADLASVGDLVCILDAAAPDAALVSGLVRVLEPIARANEALQERRSVEGALARRDATLRALTRATRTFSHDSGVFLGIIVGFGCNLRDGLAGTLSSTQMQHVQRMLDAAQSAARMLEAHTSSAVVDEACGETPAVPRSRGARRMLVDVTKLTSDVVELLANTARDARVVLRHCADAPLHVWGDGLQLKQVALNLVTNALKFTPAGGHVEVTVRAASSADPRTSGADDVEQDGPAARTCVELVVRDSGPGIPVEERQRIFEHGVRLARDAGLPGSGLGLAVVREFVTLHGGRIAVEDSAGGGNTMVVSLPVDRRQRDRDADRTPASTRVPPELTVTSSRYDVP